MGLNPGLIERHIHLKLQGYSPLIVRDLTAIQRFKGRAMDARNKSGQDGREGAAG
jgi:hypothetical protein